MKISSIILFLSLAAVLAQDCSSALDCYEKALVALTNERKKFESVSAALTQKIVDLTSNISSLAGTVKDLEKQLVDKETEISALKTDLAYFHSRDQNLKDRHIDTLNVYSDAGTTNLRIKSDISPKMIGVQVDNRLFSWDNNVYVPYARYDEFDVVNQQCVRKGVAHVLRFNNRPLGLGMTHANQPWEGFGGIVMTDNIREGGTFTMSPN